MKNFDYKKSLGQNFLIDKNIIEKISVDDILLETDSPYLSPEPFRGKKNIPSNVFYVAKRIAEIKNTNVEEIVAKTCKNSVNLFDISVKI